MSVILTLKHELKMIRRIEAASLILKSRRPARRFLNSIILGMILESKSEVYYRLITIFID